MPQAIHIPASKSISNRLLILQALYPTIEIQNLSTAQDTRVLQKALHQTDNYINIGHAGTAMRFLTAYLSTLEGKEFVLDGSARMRQRPIAILVDALRQIGATIEYMKEDGYPPLKITGQKICKNTIEIDASVSSQYISALLLIGAKLPNGLQIKLKEKSVSKPYVDMTLALLEKLEIKTNLQGNIINIQATKEVQKNSFIIESDWSSASYFYGYLAVTRKQVIRLKYFQQNSLQGDSQLIKLFEKLGVTTTFYNDNQIELSGNPNFSLARKLSLNLLEMPDLAQTFAVVCLALKINCHLSGLQTLRIKETDRLLALKNEMEKLGAMVHITDSTLELVPPSQLKQNVSIKTYDDHRMAMSFAIFQKIIPLNIENKEVVAKSFPNFWELFGGV